MREFKVTQNRQGENGVPRIFKIKCQSREMARVQLHESMWFMNSIRSSDILSLIHNHQKEELTQLALFAGHHLYLNQGGQMLFEEYLLTDKTNTWWEGDILNDQGQVVAKAPKEEVLSLIREIPSHYLIRPENLRKCTPPFLGERLFKFNSKGGFTLYWKECDCSHCKRHIARFDSAL